MFALLGPIAASAALVSVRNDIRTSNVSLVLVIVVLGAALLAGRAGGAIAAIVSMGSFDFFFTRPYYSFVIESRDDVETALLLLVVGLVVGELVVRSRAATAAAVASRREVERIRNVSQLAAGGESAQRLISLVQREIVEVLGVRSCRFEWPPFPTTLPVLGHGSVRVTADEPGPVEDRSASATAGPRHPAAGSPDAHRFVELPVCGRGRRVGRFVVELETPGTGVMLAPESRALAVALVDQLGASLVGADHASP